jgi:tetratricopeptide (TPR) repeat protein
MVLLFAAASFSVSVAAQKVPSPQDTVLTPPAQVQRPEPPSPTASAHDLEMAGDRWREEKLYADAIDYYEAALKRGGENAVIRNKLGIAKLMMVHLDDARKDFERAVKLDREYPEAYNNLGVVFYYKKNFKRAIKEYDKAVKLRDESASFHSNLGSAYFARKQYEQANAEYQRAMDIDPDIFERRSSTGIALHLMSAEDRAKFDYVIARMYAKQSNFDRALLYLRKAIEDGYKKVNEAYTDSEFAALRKDPRFNELMAAKLPAIPQ